MMEAMKKLTPITISDKVLAKCDLPNQAERFDALLETVLAVPRAEMLRREAAYREEVAANPFRRGPKTKPKSA
jgi:hypothetical protein